MKKTTYHVKLITTTDLLGSQPASLNLFKQYLISKLEKELEKIAKEIERYEKKHGVLVSDHPLIEKQKELEEKLKKIQSAETLDDLEEKGLTVFPRCSKHGSHIVIYNYQLLGNLKETAKTYFKNIRGAGNMITRYFKIEPREICLRDAEDGTPIDTVDIYERPLRAYTPAGYIVSIVRSERAEPPILIEFDLTVYHGTGTDNKLSKEEDIRKLFELGGEMVGLLQFRNGGFGRYKLQEFEKIKEENI